MEVKKYKPVTASQRNLIRLNKKFLTKKPLLKKNIYKIINKYGRNNTGKITSFHKGGGHKKKYRNIDFVLNKSTVGIVSSIEYDPYRNSNIVSIYDFIHKYYYYKLHTNFLRIGDIVETGKAAKPFIGNTLPISNIPVGSLLHNISVKKNKKAQLTRSAGTYSLLLYKTYSFGRIKLSSGKIKVISSNCFATMGRVSNDLLSLTNKGKAGRSRWLNNRPKVRGVAMNPIDHPHGGGEGKTSGGRKSSVTPWGKYVRKAKIKK